MDKTSKLQDLDLLHYILKRPAMFSIFNIELFYVFFQGYLFGREETVLRDYFEYFNDYVKDKFSREYFDEFNYDRIIRLHSMNDSHSLELLNELTKEFEKIK